MDKIQKLFNELNKYDRDFLIGIINDLLENKEGLDVAKIKNTDFYRVRKGRFRIIFHREDGIVIDSIKIRNENTYK